MPRRGVARPLRQHRASTLFLRVPSHDWPLVSIGRQHEFRAAAGNVPQLWNVPLPTLVVAYRKRRATDDYDHRLMVLEATRVERLGAITAEGLAATGYTGDDAMARFRRNWMNREKRLFDAMRKVVVFTVRLPEPQDMAVVAESLVRHLYGEYLDETYRSP